MVDDDSTSHHKNIFNFKEATKTQNNHGIKRANKFLAFEEAEILKSDVVFMTPITVYNIFLIKSLRWLRDETALKG